MKQKKTCESQNLSHYSEKSTEEMFEFFFNLSGIHAQLSTHILCMCFIWQIFCLRAQHRTHLLFLDCVVKNCSSTCVVVMISVCLYLFNQINLVFTLTRIREICVFFFVSGLVYLTHKWSMDFVDIFLFVVGFPQ